MQYRRVPQAENNKESAARFQYETMHKECNIDLCASMGFLSSEQLHRFHEVGVSIT